MKIIILVIGFMLLLDDSWGHLLPPQKGHQHTQPFIHPPHPPGGNGHGGRGPALRGAVKDTAGYTYESPKVPSEPEKQDTPSRTYTPPQETIKSHKIYTPPPRTYTLPDKPYLPLQDKYIPPLKQTHEAPNASPGRPGNFIEHQKVYKLSSDSPIPPSEVMSPPQETYKLPGNPLEFSERSFTLNEEPYIESESSESSFSNDFHQEYSIPHTTSEGHRHVNSPNQQTVIHSGFIPPDNMQTISKGSTGISHHSSPVANPVHESNFIKGTTAHQTFTSTSVDDSSFGQQSYVPPSLESGFLSSDSSKGSVFDGTGLPIQSGQTSNRRSFRVPHSSSFSNQGPSGIYAPPPSPLLTFPPAPVSEFAFSSPLPFPSLEERVSFSPNVSPISFTIEDAMAHPGNFRDGFGRSYEPTSSNLRGPDSFQRVNGIVEDKFGLPFFVKQSIQGQNIQDHGSPQNIIQGNSHLSTSSKNNAQQSYNQPSPSPQNFSPPSGQVTSPVTEPSQKYILPSNPFPIHEEAQPEQNFVSVTSHQIVGSSVIVGDEGQTNFGSDLESNIFAPESNYIPPGHTNVGDQNSIQIVSNVSPINSFELATTGQESSELHESTQGINLPANLYSPPEVTNQGEDTAHHADTFNNVVHSQDTQHSYLPTESTLQQPLQPEQNYDLPQPTYNLPEQSFIHQEQAFNLPEQAYIPPRQTPQQSLVPSSNSRPTLSGEIFTLPSSSSSSQGSGLNEHNIGVSEPGISYEQNFVPPSTSISSFTSSQSNFNQQSFSTSGQNYGQEIQTFNSPSSPQSLNENHGQSLGSSFSFQSPDQNIMSEQTNSVQDKNHGSIERNYNLPQQSYIPPDQNFIPIEQSSIRPGQSFVQAGQIYTSPHNSFDPPVNTKPEQTFVSSQQNFSPPEQSFGSVSFSIPEQNSGPIQQFFTPPEQSYGPPEQSFNPPEPNVVPQFSSEPEQIYNSPQQNFSPPEQNFGPISISKPEQIYSTPQQTFSPHEQNFGPVSNSNPGQISGPPQQNFGPHQQSFGPVFNSNPEQIYSPPQQIFSPHEQSFGPVSNSKPGQIFGPPQQNFSPNEQSFGPVSNSKPEQIYNSPQQNFNPPGQSFGPVSNSNPGQISSPPQQNFSPPGQSFGPVSNSNLDQIYGPPQQNFSPNEQSFGPVSNSKPGQISSPPQQNFSPPGQSFGSVSNSKPEQIYNSPQQNFNPPGQSFGPMSNSNPGQISSPPQQNFSPPGQSFGTVSNSNLDQIYGPPQQNFSPNEQSFGPVSNSKPGQISGPPQQNFSPPGQSFGSVSNSNPDQIYGPPQQNFGQPEQTFGPISISKPEQTYISPEQEFNPPEQSPVLVSISDPKQTYDLPTQIFTSPKQSFGPSINSNPDQNFGPVSNPEQTYNLPEQNFGPPEQTTGPVTILNPEQTYSIPEQNSIPPQQNFGPSSSINPEQNYDLPELNSNPPEQNFGSPITSNPQQTHSSPEQNYGPPQQSFIPSSNSKPEQTYGLPEPIFGPPLNSSPEETYGLPEENYAPPQEDFGPSPISRPQQEYIPPESSVPSSVSEPTQSFGFTEPNSDLLIDSKEESYESPNPSQGGSPDQSFEGPFISEQNDGLPQELYGLPKQSPVINMPDPEKPQTSSAVSEAQSPVFGGLQSFFVAAKHNYDLFHGQQGFSINQKGTGTNPGIQNDGAESYRPPEEIDRPRQIYGTPVEESDDRQSGFQSPGQNSVSLVQTYDSPSDAKNPDQAYNLPNIDNDPPSHSKIPDQTYGAPDGNDRTSEQSYDQSSVSSETGDVDLEYLPPKNNFGPHETIQTSIRQNQPEYEGPRSFFVAAKHNYDIVHNSGKGEGGSQPLQDTEDDSKESEGYGTLSTSGNSLSDGISGPGTVEDSSNPTFSNSDHSLGVDSPNKGSSVNHQSFPASTSQGESFSVSHSSSKSYSSSSSSSTSSSSSSSGASQSSGSSCSPSASDPDGDCVRGEILKDYPAFTSVPETSFQCQGRSPGFYADGETQCQVWHYCLADGRQESFLCPTGTLFNQRHFICDWWFNTNCTSSQEFYRLNDALYERYTESRTSPSEGRTENENPIVTDVSPAARGLGDNEGLQESFSSSDIPKESFSVPRESRPKQSYGLRREGYGRH